VPQDFLGSCTLGGAIAEQEDRFMPQGIDRNLDVLPLLIPLPKLKIILELRGRHEAALIWENLSSEHPMKIPTGVQLTLRLLYYFHQQSKRPRPCAMLIGGLCIFFGGIYTEQEFD
jgi:hypothetical protein